MAVILPIVILGVGTKIGEVRRWVLAMVNLPVRGSPEWRMKMIGLLDSESCPSDRVMSCPLLSKPNLIHFKSDENFKSLDSPLLGMLLQDTSMIRVTILCNLLACVASFHYKHNQVRVFHYIYFCFILMFSFVLGPFLLGLSANNFVSILKFTNSIFWPNIIMISSASKF